VYLVGLICKINLQDSLLLKYDPVLQSNMLPMFWRNTLHSPSRVCRSEKNPLNIQHMSHL